MANSIDLDKLRQEKERQERKRQESVELWIKRKQRQRKQDSTQSTLTFDEIYEDGTIRADDKYTKLMEFQDINYQLATDEEQAHIFDEWAGILNSFDSSVIFQNLFWIKQANDFDQSRLQLIPDNDDDFNSVREEYDEILNEQLSKGHNSVIKRKLMAYTVTSDSYEHAKDQLNRITNELKGRFQTLQVAYSECLFMNVIEILHSMLNPAEPRQLGDFDEVIHSGLTTKDMVAPMSFNFMKDGSAFKMNNSYSQVGYMEILASEMSDKLLAELMEIPESNLLISFKVFPIEQHKAIKYVKTKITSVEAMKIDEQKKAVRSGYDMDILPPELKSNIQEAENFLVDLKENNEHAFNVVITIMCTADSEKLLENTIYQVKSLLQRYNVNYKGLNYQQEEGLMTTLPIGVNQLFIDRMLTTSSLGIYIPFTTQELFQTTEGALYYGLNAISQNMILADRKKLRNPNGLILGTPGSGKSFGAKREILNSFLATNDDIIITDPEAEYWPLVERLNGQVIRLSPNSEQHLNPLDINMNYSEGGKILSLKIDFVTSMMELILGGEYGLRQIERSIISRATENIYEKYLEDPTPENVPILSDLYLELRRQPEPEAKELATGMEMYISGSLGAFNHKTNVDLTNRIICFDIRDLGKQLKKLGMLIVQDQTWNKVTMNRYSNHSTRLYIDEFHLLLRDKQTASYSSEIWKRFRKWGGVPTGLTQNIKDLLSSSEIENIFDNSDFVLLFNQSAGDREILAEKLKISPSQQNYISNSPAGEGLIIYGNVTLPFRDNFPSHNSIYSLLTTKPGETLRPGEK